MSQFVGYAVPGLVFLVFGLKWAIEAIREPNPDKDRKVALESRCRSMRRKLLCCRVKGLPAEGIIKLSITGAAMVGSLLAAYPNGQLHKMSDILYATIYLFFAISGLVDVLVFYCPHSMPLGIESFVLSMSFLIEGLMFHLNLTHQSFMMQHVHILLVYTIYATAFILLVEIVYDQTIVKFVRGFLTLLHGSWYIQSGFILHNPFQSTPSTWLTGYEYNNALLGISLTYAWHAATTFVILLILLAILRRNHKMSDSATGLPMNRADGLHPISNSTKCTNCRNNGSISNL